MRILPVCIIVGNILMLCGCSRWPPHQQEIIDHFYEYKDNIVALEAMLRDSEYSQVSRMFEGVVHAYYYDEETGSHYVPDFQSPPNSTKWDALFSDSHVTLVGYSVLDNSTVVASGMNYYSGTLSKRYRWQTEYAHDPSLSERIVECSKDLPTTESGHCIVKLSEGWWLRYVWNPPWPDELE